MSFHPELRNRIPAIGLATRDAEKQGWQRFGVRRRAIAVEQSDFDLVLARGRVLRDGDGIADFPAARQPGSGVLSAGKGQCFRLATQPVGQGPWYVGRRNTEVAPAREERRARARMDATGVAEAVDDESVANAFQQLVDCGDVALGYGVGFCVEERSVLVTRNDSVSLEPASSARVPICSSSKADSSKVAQNPAKISDNDSPCRRGRDLSPFLIRPPAHSGELCLRYSSYRSRTP